METQIYCDNIMAELSGWKSKIDNVVGRFDHASSNDRRQVMNEVDELHKITDELDQRIHGLQRECAGGFKPEK